jgi:hypothetical protein
MKSDSELRRALEDLLEELLAISKDNVEIFDTDIREQMHEAVYDGFLKPKEHFVTPDEFGMFSEEANKQIKAALEKYIKRANDRSEKIGLSDPNERLSAFQDGDVTVGEEGVTPDEFFGWAESI